jgi:hypothetical protein
MRFAPASQFSALVYTPLTNKTSRGHDTIYGGLMAPGGHFEGIDPPEIRGQKCDLRCFWAYFSKIMRSWGEERKKKRFHHDPAEVNRGTSSRGRPLRY